MHCSNAWRSRSCAIISPGLIGKVSEVPFAQQLKRLVLGYPSGSPLALK
jgi:hypothetical protein